MVLSPSLHPESDDPPRVKPTARDGRKVDVTLGADVELIPRRLDGA